MNNINQLASLISPANVGIRVCPTAIPGAQAPVSQILGYIMWGVQWLFIISAIIGIGAILAGVILKMQHAAKAGIIGLIVAAIAGIGYLVVPAIYSGIIGNGCVSF